MEWNAMKRNTLNEVPSFSDALEQHEKNYKWNNDKKKFVEKGWLEKWRGAAPAKKKKPRKGKGKKKKPSKSKGKKRKPSKGRGKGTPKRKPTKGSRKKATHRAKQVVHTLQRKGRGKKSKRGAPKRRAGARVQANPYSEQFEFQI